MTASVPETSKGSGQDSPAFPRSMRLRRHTDFERVYKQGRRQFSANMTVFYLQREPDPDAGIRVGFTVGRALGGAVTRNRMKRVLREAVRLSKPPKRLNADVVINPKKSLLAADFEAVKNEVRRAFDVMEQKLAGKKATTENETARSRKPEAGSR